MKIKATILTVLFLLTSIISLAQTQKDLYEQSLKEIDNKNYEKAIKLMDEFITKYPDFEKIHMIYLNRATAKSFIKDYNGALKDYTAAYEKNSSYAEAIRQRGYLKSQMGDLKAALDDYDLALNINPKLATCYINKADALDSLGKREEACKNYERALELGDTYVVEILSRKCDSNSIVLQKYIYKILVDKSDDKTYGFRLENPIKVGHGPSAQSAYLDLLRDVQGNKVKYEREGSAGYYASENGLFGMAMVDSYNITFKDVNGKKKKAILFLSFYDYEQPKIPFGFYSIEDFEKK